MASLLPQPKQLFQDNAWNPLVGGQIFTYEAGTLTPKATFQDSALTIANTNPVIVNARGEVVMFGDGAYRVIAKDSADNTLYDVDNIESASSLAASSRSAVLALLAAANGSTLIGYRATDTATPRTAQTKLRESLSFKDFGAVGDGSTDDTAAVQAAFDYVKANGGALEERRAATYKIGAISLTGSAKAWRFTGAGIGATVFVRKDDAVGTLFASSSSSVPFEMEDFTVDCKHSTQPNGNHGMSIADMNGLRLRRIFVRDYKNSSILIFATTSNTFNDCVAIDCHSDGLNVANNGMLVAELNRSGFVNCTAIGAKGSPGYGLQLKNDCRYCFIVNGYAEGCAAGIAFGNDSAVSGVKQSSVIGGKVNTCTSAFFAGYAERNSVQGLQIDMSSTGENAIDLQTNCVGNSMDGVVIINLAAAKGAVRFRSGASDNTVNIDLLDNINSSGVAAIYDAGSARNKVKLSSLRNPLIPALGVTSLVSDASTDNTNSLLYTGYPAFERLTIATDAITLRNQVSESVILDTEGGAATDDLSTINGHVAEGRTITLRTNSNLRDVVVKHNVGNILLNGLADFTLDATADTLTLRYNTTLSRWTEVGRGNNT